MPLPGHVQGRVLHSKYSLWWVVSTIQGKPDSSWSGQGALPALPLDTQLDAAGSTNLLSSLLLLLFCNLALPKRTFYNYIFALLKVEE